MKHIQNWLPETCLSAPKLFRPTGGVLKEWVSDWFTSSSVCIPDSWEVQVHTDFHTGALELNAIGKLPKLRSPVRLAGYDMIAIASQLLGYDIVRSQLLPLDFHVLGELVSKCLSDLNERLLSMIQASEATEKDRDDRTPWEATVKDNGGEPLFTIECDHNWLVALAFRSVTSPPRVVSLTSRERALATQQLEVAASLARTRLQIAEFDKLQAGDVLLFNDMSDHSAQLLVNGYLHQSGDFGLVEHEGKYALRVEADSVSA